MWQLADPQALIAMTVPIFFALYFLFKKRSPLAPGILPLSSPKELIQGPSQRTKQVFRLFFGLSVFAFILMVLAMSRPQRVKSTIKKYPEGIDILLALDVSESMDATDFAPSRIEVAKSVIRDFIRRRTDDRIGLIIFGGEAMTKCPLTLDYNFLLNQVEDVHLRELKQGTAIGMALANAVTRLRHSESKNRVIILLTDGDSNVGAINPITAAQLAQQEGIKIYSIGIGKADRVVVPIYAYDIYGKRSQLLAQVPSYLNPELLQEISGITHGKAYMARDPGALNKILAEIDKLEKTKTKMVSVEKREDASFPLAASFTLLLVSLYLLQETRYRKARLRHAIAF